MERTGTKQAILDAALDLFSVQGYEETSVAQIADAVGIRKASLYSHFASKQDMLDALLQDALEQYQKHSIFVQKKTDADALAQTGRVVTVDSAVKEILGHIRYILHDAQISKVRKLLTIEQFRNPALAQIQTKMNYTDILAYFTALMRAGIRQGRLLDRDAEMMAAQLCLPISVWINLCDREPDREAETMAMIERHIRQFFKLYRNPA